MTTPAERLATVRARIDDASRAAGRDPSEVSLVAVSKYHPPADVRALHAAGQSIYAESREQDLRSKRAALADLDLGWHFIGRLQTNKAAAVAREAALIHSLDRLRLVAALAKGAADRPAPLPVLVQVSLDGDPDRGGVAPADVLDLAGRIAIEPMLDLAGVMAVAAPGGAARPQFERLAVISAVLRAEYPDAREISAGMSGDLADAIAAGATLVRIGTALFGPRASAGAEV